MPRGYYAYEEGLSPFDESKSVEFVFDIIRPSGTTTKDFHYKASGEDAIDGTLSTLSAHLSSNLEPIVFRSFYFIGTTSTLPPSAIFERDIRFLDLAAWGSMTALRRPDQFTPKYARIDEVVNNLQGNRTTKPLKSKNRLNCEQKGEPSCSPIRLTI